MAPGLEPTTSWSWVNCPNNYTRLLAKRLENLLSKRQKKTRNRRHFFLHHESPSHNFWENISHIALCILNPCASTFSLLLSTFEISAAAHEFKEHVLIKLTSNDNFDPENIRFSFLDSIPITKASVEIPTILEFSKNGSCYVSNCQFQKERKKERKNERKKEIKWMKVGCIRLKSRWP